jgi:hypothetical protein
VDAQKATYYCRRGRSGLPVSESESPRDRRRGCRASLCLVLVRAEVADVALDAAGVVTTPAMQAKIAFSASVEGMPQKLQSVVYPAVDGEAAVGEVARGQLTSMTLCWSKLGKKTTCCEPRGPARSAPWLPGCGTVMPDEDVSV